MTSYYELDDILAEEETIKCVFRVAVVGMGKLDEHTGDDDLKEGSVLELPYWLCCALVERNMAELDLPRYFGDRFRTNLLVDPTVVNLNDRTPFFYELGHKVASLVQDVELADMLRKTLASRYREILRRSTRFRRTDSSVFEDRLTNIEKKLYKTKSESDKSYVTWKNRHTGRITIGNVANSAAAASSANTAAAASSSSSS